MSKEDVLDLPPVPKKRKAISEALDVHIARWLAGDLTPSDRRKLEQEKEHRKKLAKQRQFRLGIVAGEEGLTPGQLSTLEEKLSSMNATEIHHGGVASKVHNLCRATGAKMVRHGATRNQMEEQRAAIRESDFVFAFPKEFTVQPYSLPGVWSLIGYAKNRNIPVSIIMPDGHIRINNEE